MRFKISTLVDITETNKRKDDNLKEYSQQINFNTVLQTIGLRVNLVPVSVHSSIIGLKTFGKTYKGSKHRVWDFIFDVEYEGALDLTMLSSDFDLIPVVTDLDETAQNYNKIFRTTCPNECNITFEIVQE